MKGFAEKELFSCCTSLIKQSLKATVSLWWCSVVDWWHIDTFVWEQTPLKSFKYLFLSHVGITPIVEVQIHLACLKCVLHLLHSLILHYSVHGVGQGQCLKILGLAFGMRNVHLWNFDKYQANCFLDLKVKQMNGLPTDIIIVI